MAWGTVMERTGGLRAVRGARCLSLVALVAALLAVVPASRAAELRGAGGPISLNEVLKPLQGPFERATGNTLVLREADTDDVLRDLDNGTLDVVVSALPLEELVRDLKAKGTDIDGGAFQATTIVTVPVAVVVARGYTLRRLDKGQLKGVFSGAIQDWKEVGGVNEAVRIIKPWGAPISSAFRYQVMDGADYASGMIDALSWEDVRKRVVEVPDSIALLPAALVDDSVTVVETPAIVQTVTLITKGAPSPAVRQLIDFARGAGKKYLGIAYAR
ncbi:hypothetical protein GURASL_32450 [Geotalea uraniireducens]|uniref:PBP domain-containing protein n=1 Tax=Geotalea uraniireducens TaxID=351604 RepID=A0ABM8EQ16_9BACT|nr:substrate-binding domain-containing protein [Geotalea uraniireducens]BDV44322.1 hypothetical protein GURASL_32450 [Geotalea uraniireducens]